MAHGVIRTDLMHGTWSGTELRSIRYMGAASTATDIDNGNVVLVGELLTGEREVRSATTPAANSDIDAIAIVATPEVLRDPYAKNLDEFYNPAGSTCRAFLLHKHDIFSVTKDALNIGSTVTPAVGYAVELMAGTKLNVVASATASATQVGTIKAIETDGRYTWYVVEVA